MSGGHRTGSRLLLALVLGSVCGAGQAQNRLANGSFDTGLAGWTLVDAMEVSAQWVADDVGTNALSGSAEIRNSGTGNQGVLTQCVLLDGLSDPIPFGASARVLMETETEVAYSTACRSLFPPQAGH